MLGFKCMSGIEVEFSDGTKQKMTTFIYTTGTSDEDKFNIAYMLRSIGVEKKLYEYQSTVKSKNLAYLETRLKTVREKYDELAKIGLNYMMSVLYLNRAIPLKCTYVTLEDAYSAAVDIVKSLIPHYEFIVSLHYPTSTTLTMTDIQSQDFEHSARKALGITSKPKK